MGAYEFSQVDVFGSRPLSGNPLAVVHGADGLAEADLQQFARWTGLSETTFLLTPTDPAADYRVRIFTATRELPFAGHPTLGSAYAWRSAGGRAADPGVIVQECGAGLVRVRVDGDHLSFAAPPLTRFGPLDPALLDRVRTGLGLAAYEVLDASWLVNGPEWIGLRLASAERVLAVEVDAHELAGLDIGIIGRHPPGAGADVEVRAFLPGAAPAEDPVTGSLNAGLAAWLIGNGQLPPRYVAAQGTALGCAGRVQVEQLDDDLWIGGRVKPTITGTVHLD